jgi:hypothetical protein
MSAITKYIVKNTRGETIIKLVGTGTMAITLAELKLADETFDATNASVDIRSIMITSPPTQETRIVRNSVDVLQAYGNIELTSDVIKMNEQTNKDLSVITGGDGTIVISLRKNYGYNAPNLRAVYLTGCA